MDPSPGREHPTNNKDSTFYLLLVFVLLVYFSEGENEIESEMGVGKCRSILEE